MAPQMSRMNHPAPNNHPATNKAKIPNSNVMNANLSYLIRLSRIIFAALLIFASAAHAANDNNAKPYDKKLYRLSEILGAVHYLRELCSADDGMVWRDQMDKLIKAEGTNAFRRVTLIKQFNKGYRSYRRTYRTCTNSAKTAIDHFLTEGSKLSDELVEKNW